MPTPWPVLKLWKQVEYSSTSPAAADLTDSRCLYDARCLAMVSKDHGGDDKTLETCRMRFNNVTNFTNEPIV